MTHATAEAAVPPAGGTEDSEADRPPTATGDPEAASLVEPGARWCALDLGSCRKAPGDARFCASPGAAATLAARLARVIGVTGVRIEGLDNPGVPCATAVRPGARWRSSRGANSVSVEGAKVGAVMAELETWAQEQYPRPCHTAEAEASYAALRRFDPGCAVDPATLGIPLDSAYHPDLRIGWRICEDLLGARRLLVPSAAVVSDRVSNDIFYSSRQGGKTLSTTGLAAGFALEEAVTHAICEGIARHASALASPGLGDPGGDAARVRAIDLATVPRSVRQIADKLASTGRVRLVDITCEIRVPTFAAAVMVGETLIAQGDASHPDPEVAAHMALLKAARALVVDLERGREPAHARVPGGQRRDAADGRESCPDATQALVPFDSVRGFVSRDAGDDVRWLLARIRDAGFPRVLMIDYSADELRPARVVRILVPGLG